MKKAFTFIELIFVIVILGILAAIAIPKLMGTREDAQASSLATQIQAATKEIISYYTTQGVDVNFSELPNSSQIVLNELIHHGWVEIKNSTHAVIYSNRETESVCFDLYTDGKTIWLEQNNSDNDVLCEDMKRIIKDVNYSVLNQAVKF